MISVLAGEDDRGFGVGRGFESFNPAVVGDFGLLNGFQLILQTGTDGADVGLDPDQSRGVASGAENLGELAAVFLGVVAAFEDESRAGLCNFGDEEQNELTREIVFLFQSVQIIECGVKLGSELLTECGFAATGCAEDKNCALASAG